jgi:succinate dehydrogenase hydrophobic anchor subunit
MLQNWKTGLLFMFLSGLILLFIVAPLLGMFLRTTPGQYVETVATPWCCEASA